MVVIVVVVVDPAGYGQYKAEKSIYSPLRKKTAASAFGHAGTSNKRWPLFEGANGKKDFLFLVFST